MIGLLFGTATRDITPAYPVWLHGYAARDHASLGVCEPISLGCLAISDGEQRALLFAIDMIGIEAHVCERLYRLIERETGVGYPYIMLSCTHTHFAPALHAMSSLSAEAGIAEPDARFIRDFEYKLVEAAQEALRNLQPGRLEMARIAAPQVLFNRRTVKADGAPQASVQTNFMYPDDPAAYRFSPTDHELTALRVRDEDGVRAVWLNFGCHPVTGGQTREQDHYRISADYAYYARRTIAETLTCPVFYTLGAAGDTVPINRYGRSRQQIGGVLGNSVLLSERLFVADEGAELKADTLEVEMQTILTTTGAAQQEYDQARAALAALSEQDGAAYRVAAEVFSQKMTALMRARLYPENRFPVKVQFLKIGRTTLVGLGFEVLSEFSLRMKTRFPQSVLLSCTGGYQGYLPFAYEYARGGYEATAASTHFMPGTADRLLEETLRRLETL